MLFWLGEGVERQAVNTQVTMHIIPSNLFEVVFGALNGFVLARDTAVGLYHETWQ